MRGLQALGAAFALLMFVYAVGSYAVISMALLPGSHRNDPAAKPLAEAAPEVTAIRGDLRRLAMKALTQVPYCVDRKIEEDPARPRGKVLLWDVDQNDVSIAHGCLPKELRVQSPTEPCTVYLITERQRSHSLDYKLAFWSGGGDAGVKGFRVDLVVCAVDLPSLQARGRYRIEGEGPPSMTTFDKGVTEIEENWAANLKRFIDVCQKGPEPDQVWGQMRYWYQHCTAAKDAIGPCEQMGSLPALGNYPREVAIYNPQTDRRHPASDHVVGLAGLEDENMLVVFPLEDRVVIDKAGRSGRIDTRVALVAMPGAQPLGVYQVQGEPWPLPQDTHEAWHSSHNSRSPDYQLVRWVHDLLRQQRGLPPGTIPVRPGETHLAGTPWLQGPGWRDHGKN
jgi:hypothetical protein